MKTQQKFQHQSQLRKSPRFSSAHLSARFNPISTPKSKTRPDDAWALSLHVVEQVPLKICYPSDEEDKSFRRSSRLAANKYKTPSPKSSRPKSLPALPASQLKRSQRSSSFSSLTVRDGKNVVSGEKRRRFLEDRGAKGRVRKKAKMGSDEMILRRSYRLKGGVNGNSTPQPLALPEPGSCSKSAKKCFLSEKCLRSRSVLMHKVEKISTKKNDFGIKYLGPPLITEKGPVKLNVGNEKEKGEKSTSKKSAGGEILGAEYSENLSSSSLRRSRKDCGESSKIEMLGSPEKSAFSSEKCLWPSSVEMQLQEESLEKGGSVLNEKCLMSPKIESVLDELFGDSEEGDEEKCDSDVSSEKCLRSGKIKLKVNVDENTEKTTDRVEGPCGSKGKCNEEKTVKSEKREKSVVCCFIGEPIPEEVAQKKWQWRYELKSKKKGKSWKIK